jgi:hypothetical protein
MESVLHFFVYAVLSCYCHTEVFAAYLFLSGSAAQRGPWPPRPRGFRYHTQRRATVGRTPLNE